MQSIEFLIAYQQQLRESGDVAAIDAIVVEASQLADSVARVFETSIAQQWDTGALDDLYVRVSQWSRRGDAYAGHAKQAAESEGGIDTAPGLAIAAAVSLQVSDRLSTLVNDFLRRNPRDLWRMVHPVSDAMGRLARVAASCWTNKEMHSHSAILAEHAQSKGISCFVLKDWGWLLCTSRPRTSKLSISDCLSTCCFRLVDAAHGLRRKRDEHAEPDDTEAQLAIQHSAACMARAVVLWSIAASHGFHPSRGVPWQDLLPNASTQRDAHGRTKQARYTSAFVRALAPLRTVQRVLLLAESLFREQLLVGEHAAHAGRLQPQAWAVAQGGLLWLRRIIRGGDGAGGSGSAGSAGLLQVDWDNLPGAVAEQVKGLCEEDEDEDEERIDRDGEAQSRAGASAAMSRISLPLDLAAEAGPSSSASLGVPAVPGASGTAQRTTSAEQPSARPSKAMADDGGEVVDAGDDDDATDYGSGMEDGEKVENAAMPSPHEPAQSMAPSSAPSEGIGAAQVDSGAAPGRGGPQAGDEEAALGTKRTRSSTRPTAAMQAESIAMSLGLSQAELQGAREQSMAMREAMREGELEGELDDLKDEGSYGDGEDLDGSGDGISKGGDGSMAGGTGGRTATGDQSEAQWQHASRGVPVLGAVLWRCCCWLLADAERVLAVEPADGSETTHGSREGESEGEGQQPMVEEKQGGRVAASSGAGDDSSSSNSSSSKVNDAQAASGKSRRSAMQRGALFLAVSVGASLLRFAMQSDAKVKKRVPSSRRISMSAHAAGTGTGAAAGEAGSSHAAVERLWWSMAVPRWAMCVGPVPPRPVWRSAHGRDAGQPTDQQRDRGAELVAELRAAMEAWVREH